MYNRMCGDHNVFAGFACRLLAFGVRSFLNSREIREHQKSNLKKQVLSVLALTAKSG